VSYISPFIEFIYCQEGIQMSNLFSNLHKLYEFSWTLILPCFQKHYCYNIHQLIFLNLFFNQCHKYISKFLSMNVKESLLKFWTLKICIDYLIKSARWESMDCVIHATQIIKIMTTRHAQIWKCNMFKVCNLKNELLPNVVDLWCLSKIFIGLLTNNQWFS
jgi:hypothetical protein